MPFRNYLCWTPNLVNAAMNPDAETIPDEVFLAVHQEIDIRVSAPEGSSPKRMSPKEFLKAFLDPKLSHVQVAILGESGSGKSHFVQWMRLNIPAMEDRYVLTIAKARTSLKNIIHSIVSLLPDESRAKYQDELDRTAQHILTPEGQRIHLLDQLALAIRMDRTRNTGGEIEELETELIKVLPDLFHDPDLRKRLFLKDGTIIDELANHIFAQPQGYKPKENRREFTADDLPAVGGSAYVDAAKPTRDALDILMMDQDVTIPLALDIINRSLNPAIALTLSISGDSLIDLMNDIRRFLRSQGKSLILLIEDFARLQGIDHALLQALITPGAQGEEQLCEIRWAMAVTTGYYEKTADTVQTRMNFVVSMDLPAGEGKNGFIGKRELASFAAGYLNAARVGPQDLKAWHSQNSSSGDEPSEVPNACSQCQHRKSCHSSFGESKGIGLYPFTQKALWNMARRADERINERFNPRRFINSVLTKVLDTYADHLSSGQFPPRMLLNDLGNVNALLAARQQDLRARDAANFERRLTLLELWNGTDAVVNLASGIHEAFDLPALVNIGIASPEPGGDGDQPEPEPTPTGDPRLKSRLNDIEQWLRGGDMPQDLATFLRERIYLAIDSFIDWDAAGFEKTAFAARTGNKPFRQVSINFLRQQTQALPSVIRLDLPLDPKDEGELNRTAIAFQGLIQFDKHRHWGFEGGQTALMNLLDCLERWSAEVLTQIRKLDPPSDTWQTTTAALELLALGGVLSGRIALSKISATEILNTCFQSWPQPTETHLHSPELRGLYARIFSKQEKLASLVRSWHSGTKGGRKGAFVDPLVLLPTISRIQKKWDFSKSPPENAPTREFDEIFKLYSEVARNLGEAADNERRMRLDWLDLVERNVADGEKRSDIVGAVKEQLKRISEVGIPVRKGLLNEVKKSLDLFQAVQFDDCVRNFRSLRQEEDSQACIPQYSFGRANTVNMTREFFEVMSRFQENVDEAIRSVDAELQQSAGGEFKNNVDRLEKCLDELNSEMAYWESVNADQTN